VLRQGSNSLSTTTDRHEIAEILLRVALNTINQNPMLHIRVFFVL
jgi:hypothetical protein